MNTQPLPIQVSGAGPAPARAGQNAAPSADGAQFSQALSREIEQRQQTPAPAAKPAAPAQQQAAPAPNSQVVQEPAKADDAGASAADPAAGAAADHAKDDAADAAAATPVADMLALVASFNQPLQKAPAAAVQGAATPAADPLAAVGAAASEAIVPATLAAIPAGSGEAPQQQPGFAGKQLAPALPASPATPADAARNAAFQAIAQGAVRARAPSGGEEAAVQPGVPFVRKPEQAPAETLAPAKGAVPAADAAPVAASATAQAPTAQAAPVGARDIAADRAALKEAPLAALKEAPLAAPKEIVPAAPLLAPVQQASLAMAQATVGAPTDRIAARVGTPGWDNQVGQKIVWMVAGKEQSASLTLNPPDLGPMQVVLSVTNDQASVTFSSAQPEVRQALENAMPKLREMMSENGIALGNATVDAGMPDQRQAQQGEQARGQGSGARFGATGGTAEPAAALAPSRQARPGRDGLVDTFA